MRFKDIIKDNIDPTYFDRLAFVESSGNPNAKAKTSSAAGLYQFTESTWKGLVKQMGLDYTLEDRFDPEKSRQVVEQLTKDNERYLKRKLGRDIKPSELYLAHFLGMGGSRNLLQAYDEDPTVSAADVLSEAQINSNKSVFYDEEGNIRSIGDIYKWSNKKMNQDVPEEFYARMKKENEGYDFYNDPDKLFTPSNKKKAPIVNNPKTQEAMEMIDSRKQQFGYLTSQQFKQNRQNQVASMQKGGEVVKRKGVRINPDNSESTHLMTYGESDGGYVAYPTLFQNEQGEWYELNTSDAFEEAKRKNEIYKFETEAEAKSFAAGSWKDKYNL